jgi:hypothetical protein
MKVKTVLSAAILVRPLELTLLLRAMILFGIIFAFEVGILTTAKRIEVAPDHSAQPLAVDLIGSGAS